MDRIGLNDLPDANISVVKIKGGKLHINNEQNNSQFKYVWEENEEYYVSFDGETWQYVIKDFAPTME